MSLFSKAVEANERPLIGAAALFALFALAIWYAYSAMPSEDDGLNYNDIFSSQEELQQKYETLKALKAYSTTNTEPLSKADKLKVLESLRTQ